MHRGRIGQLRIIHFRNTHLFVLIQFVIGRAFALERSPLDHAPQFSAQGLVQLLVNLARFDCALVGLGQQVVEMDPLDIHHNV